MQVCMQLLHVHVQAATLYCLKNLYHYKTTFILYFTTVTFRALGVLYRRAITEMLEVESAL